MNNARYLILTRSRKACLRIAFGRPDGVLLAARCRCGRDGSWVRAGGEVCLRALFPTRLVFIQRKDKSSLTGRSKWKLRVNVSWFLQCYVQTKSIEFTHDSVSFLSKFLERKGLSVGIGCSMRIRLRSRYIKRVVVRRDSFKSCSRFVELMRIVGWKCSVVLRVREFLWPRDSKVSSDGTSWLGDLSLGSKKLFDEKENAFLAHVGADEARDDEVDVAVVLLSRTFDRRVDPAESWGKSANELVLDYKVSLLGHARSLQRRIQTRECFASHSDDGRARMREFAIVKQEKNEDKLVLRGTKSGMRCVFVTPKLEPCRCWRKKKRMGSCVPRRDI